MAEAPPPRLRDEVARTLVPVRPLPPVVRRLLAVLPAALAAPAAVPVLWGVRADAGAVGPVLLWAGSGLQAAAALLVLATAIGESTPGRLKGTGSLTVRATSALFLLATLASLTFLASPTGVPALQEARYLRVCLVHTVQLGLLPLAGAGLVVAGGLTARPVVAAALAGLGAGLASDAGWRLYCHVSAPAHVLTAHLGAVAALTALGASAGALARWWPRPRS